MKSEKNLKNCSVVTNARHHHRACVCQPPLVHVAGHLVEHQPVSLGAVLDEEVNVSVILILTEISPHLPLDQQVAKPDKIYKSAKKKS